MTARTLLATLLALLAGACGVPTDDGADVISEDDVPFGLLDEDREPVAGPDPSGQVVVEIYLHDEDEDVLVPVTRRLEEVSLEQILTALQRGPTDGEARRGLRSPLTEIDAVAGVTTEAGVAAIDLAESFADISGSEQLVAIAQLVYTATARPGVGQVGFTLAGQAVEIPRGDGSLTGDIVTRSDYPSLAPQG